MNYKAVIFDFDGTLADTSPGILNCHRYAHQAMGRDAPSETVLRSVIGSPLLQTYQSVFGFSAQDAREAVEQYRKRYAEKGIYEAECYPGMGAVLRRLKDSGCRLGIATLKAQRFIDIMLQNMGIKDFFDAAYGMDNADSYTKAELIKLCVHSLQVEFSGTILVGDSSYDRNGAREAGVDFLGVTYGFGFKRGTKAAQVDAVAMADACVQLPGLLL